MTTTTLLSPILAFVGVVGLPALIALAMASYTIRLGKEAITEKVKASIKSEYDQKLTRLQAELKASNDVELEKQRHLLNLESQRFSHQFSRLHEKRLIVISEVYASITDALHALRNYTSVYENDSMGTKAERFQSLVDAHAKFIDVFGPNKIYLPKSTADRILTLSSGIANAARQFAWKVDKPGGQGSSTEEWIRIFEDVKGPLTQSADELESEFRRLMGDHEDHQDNTASKV